MIVISFTRFFSVNFFSFVKIIVDLFSFNNIFPARCTAACFSLLNHSSQESHWTYLLETFLHDVEANDTNRDILWAPSPKARAVWPASGSIRQDVACWAITSLGRSGQTSGQTSVARLYDYEAASGLLGQTHLGWAGREDWSLISSLPRHTTLTVIY